MTTKTDEKERSYVKLKKDRHRKSKSSTLSQEGAQSIHRTVSLLRTVAEYNGRGSRLSQIARKAGLPITTVHRILAALVSEGFIEHDPMSKHYHLGIELYTLGIKAQQFAIRDKYRMSLECIAQETEDSVYLVMRSGFDALCVEHIESKFPIRIMAYNVGSRRPLGIGTASLALLSFSRDYEIETILEANKLQYKKHNNKTVQNLRSLINLTRKFGYVFNEGNYMKGVNGVGVPIYNHQGNVVAAISVAAISERIDQARSKKIARLIKSEIALVR